MAITLYDASVATLPSEQGWLAFGTGLIGTQTVSANGTLLNTTALIADVAGYGNHSPAAATLVNPTFPALDGRAGFGLDIRLRLLQETHLAANRAGFSVTLLDQGPSPRGIEIGFWTNSVFSQAGGATPFQAIGERLDGIDTTQATDYSLRIIDQTYYLTTGNRLLLRGSVQDYSQAALSPLFPYNPYTTPNFLFLGDNTGSASGRAELGGLRLARARRGSDAANRMRGTAGADLINGMGGPDELRGKAGDDWLIGGPGDDLLKGDIGDDWLIGGEGADRFLFGLGGPFDSGRLGVDNLLDFDPAQDRLRLTRFTFTALPAGPGLSPAAFAVVSGEAAAALSSALLVYDSSGCGVYYNPNGAAAGFADSATGGGRIIQFPTDAGAGAFPVLSAAVFEIV